MFVTPAFAQGAGAGEAGSLLVQIMPFVLIFAIMYFLVIRPQRQRVKQHQEMIKAIRRGDTIVTNGGLIGKVAKVVDESEILLDIAEGTRVRIARAMIADVRAKGEPVKDEG